MDKRTAADFLEGILREQKIEKYTFFLNQSEKQELNLENEVQTITCAELANNLR